MRHPPCLLLAAALMLAAAPPSHAEDLEGQLFVGENLDLFLLPEPGLFQKVFGAVGLASPPEPVNLTETARHGRDEVLVAVPPPAEDGEDEPLGTWDLYAKVKGGDGEEAWYRIARSAFTFTKIGLQEGVKIRRVKKGALDVFEGQVKGDPWLLRVEAPAGLGLDKAPERAPVDFWLNEFVFSYDEVTHSTSSGDEKEDDYTVLRRALVTVLPDELDPESLDPQPFERLKQLETYVRKAGYEELAPLRDLVEAKVQRMQALEDGGAEGEPFAAAKARYASLLEVLRERTADE